MAGKARKNREKAASRRRKKARREANQVHYQSLRDSGQNKKSKRYLQSTRRNKTNHEKHQHAVPHCGNLGCKKCFPRKDKLHVKIAKEKAHLKSAIRSKLNTLKIVPANLVHFR